MHVKYPPVDLFISYDSLNAVSVINGSVVSYRKDSNSKDLFQQLDAILLWSKIDGFSQDFINWDIETAKNIQFQMSIIPSYASLNIKEQLNNILANLEDNGIKTYYAGSTYYEISLSIVNMIENAMKSPKRFQRKAKSFSFDLIKIENEYDFQNIIHLVLKTIYQDIESENYMITIDGSRKNADFGIMNNKIVIEAKWIDSASKKAEVLKTLSGLSNFYSENSNVKCLIFMILCKKEVEIDKELLEYKFSYERKEPQILVRFITNEYLK